MKTKEITYSKLFSLGNFQNEKIEITMQVEENENPQESNSIMKLMDLLTSGTGWPKY